MRNTLLLLLFLTFYSSFCQNYEQIYFRGKSFYCGTDNAEALKVFNAGVELLHLTNSKKYLEKTADVFFKAYKMDTTFCDAAFFTGYTMRLVNNKNAIVFYYLADSLAQNKSPIFKSNLAAEALRIGNVPAVKLARKKYVELMEYFSENPEGYYGVALTAPMIGDIDNGLKCVDIAVSKYLKQNNQVNDDVYFLKGILLTLSERYAEALQYFEKTQSSFKNDENFKIHYSLSLLKVSQANSDLAMRKKAEKVFKKIKNKDDIPESIKKHFKF